MSLFRRPFDRTREWMPDEDARAMDLVGMILNGQTVVVTPRGVEIPLSNVPEDWTVLEFTRLLAQIERLPEAAASGKDTP